MVLGRDACGLAHRCCHCRRGSRPKDQKYRRDLADDFGYSPHDHSSPDDHAPPFNDDSSSVDDDPTAHNHDDTSGYNYHGPANNNYVSTGTPHHRPTSYHRRSGAGSRGLAGLHAIDQWGELLSGRRILQYGRTWYDRRGRQRRGDRVPEQQRLAMGAFLTAPDLGFDYEGA
ncbi:MAG TPA: hypothetical protein VG205_02745 [Acidimicrobiales bacterium]|nr:hypothetical protein [Acidimicrobiales bacterium]